jgi:hypothetical protein
VKLFIAQKRKSALRTVSGDDDRFEVLVKDGDKLKHIGSGEPTVVEITMSQTDESLHLENIKVACHFSSLGLSPRLEYQLMLEAYSAQRNGDYRKALIEATTALEICLTNRAKQEFTKQNISFGEGLLNKFRTLSGRFELLRLLSIELPNTNYKALIIEPRNGVIRKADPVSEPQAKQVINQVEQLLQLFSPQVSEGVKT